VTHSLTHSLTALTRRSRQEQALRHLQHRMTDLFGAWRAQRSAQAQAQAQAQAEADRRTAEAEREAAAEAAAGAGDVKTQAQAQQKVPTQRCVFV
jgi:hypothetical protein